jgi:superfamily I DNA/RNA helicase
MAWLVHRDELTAEQSRAVELNPREHRLILGSPGSGKTIVLLHRARHLADEYGVPAAGYRIMVFTRALKAYIRSALQDLDLPDDCVTTFDAWCLDYYHGHIDKRTPWDAVNKQMNYETLHQAVWEKTRTLSAVERPYHFVMVDEGQDLDKRAFEILKAVAQHVTVFMDHKQQLYENGADEQAILQALGLKRCNLTLLQAYRCSPYIVQVAASFVRDPTERENFIRQHPLVSTAKQMPLLYFGRDAADERDHLIEMVRNRIDKNDRMAILFPTKRQVYGYAQALQAAGLEVEVPAAPGAKKGTKSGAKKTGKGGKASGTKGLPGIDFTTPLPKLMPYPSAKGLTFDTVLMPRLIAGSFDHLTPGQLERWLFVGITRATQWVYFSTVNDARFMFLERFQELERQKQVTIKIGADLLAGHPSKAPTQAPGEGDDRLDDTDDLSDLV